MVTIQLLGIDPDNVDQLMWYWVSRSPKTFANAVQTYTNYNLESKIADMTLAGSAWDESWFWFDWWNTENNTNTSDDEPSDSSEYKRFPYGEVKPQKPVPPLVQRVYKWKECLAKEYGSAGCTFWLTQQHRLKGVDNGVVSAVFAVFRGRIDQYERRIVVARNLQDLMVDHVLEVYEGQITDQWTLLARNIRDYLQGEIILPEATKNRLTKLKPVFVSRLPFLVEGERGTGKLTVAKSIFEVWKATVTPSQENYGDARIINGAELQGDIHHIKKILTSKGLGEGYSYRSFNGTVIVDDIQLATRDAQYLLYRIIDNGLRLRPDIPGPWFILTVAPTLKRAMSEKKVIPELEIATGACRITLPTLHERLAEINDDGKARTEFRNIVQHFIKQLGKVASGLPVPEVLIEDWIGEPWHGNYTELRLAILEKAINKLDAAPY